jgi:Cu2+-exporting ATPase
MAEATRWASDGGGRRLAESSLRIGGMHCAACAPDIEGAVMSVDGVASVRVSAAAQLAVVRWDPSRTTPSQFVDAIGRAGYTAVPDIAAVARAQRQSDLKLALWRLFVAAFCSMQVMMLAAPAYFSAPGDLSPDLARLLQWASWVVTLPVMCFSASVFLQGAWRSLRNRRIGMDVPVALGIAVAFVASTAATFDPHAALGEGVYFDSLTMFVSFLLGGRYLEMQARHRAETLLEHSAVALPRTAWRVGSDGRSTEVGVGCLRRGDVLRVAAGQVFAADGTLVEGNTRVDESMLSGESSPVAKSPGDPLLAGSVNLDAPVDLRVTALGTDTRHERIRALTREAQSHRATGALRRSDRWAGPFLWMVLLLAGAAALVWSVVDPGRAVAVAVSVLIVTCPCALSLAAPSALLSAAGSMARQGLLLRRLEAIEGLARMQRLFVDKTGTLTDPPARAAGMRLPRGLPEGMDEPALRAAASTLAERSTHPWSRALAAGGGPALPGWHGFMEARGRGMQAVDPEGGVWRLGAAAWAGSADPGLVESGLPVWLGRDGHLLAGFDFGERLRPDAVRSVRALQDDGVQVSLVSGDLPTRVSRIARQAGVPEFEGGLQPEDKLRAVCRAQQRGEVVAMLGDGINDLPVLAQADVSIAMGEGAWAARAEADAVLVSNGLGDLVRARRLAKRAVRIVNQNLAWAAAYNLACVPLALAGWLPPWAAGLGMAASSLGVVLNSMRLSVKA